MKREPGEDNLPRLDNDTVRRVIARAVELDALSNDSVTPEELESIAADLGISRVALRRALFELGQATDRPRPEWVRRAKAMIPFSVAPTVLFVFPPPQAISYVTGAILDGRLEFVVAALASNGVAWLSRGKLGHLKFQLANACVWAATAAFVASPDFTLFVVERSIAAGTSFAILGSALIELRSRGYIGTSPPPSLGGGTTGGRNTEDEPRRDNLWSRLRRRFALFRSVARSGLGCGARGLAVQKAGVR